MTIVRGHGMALTTLGLIRPAEDGSSFTYPPEIQFVSFPATTSIRLQLSRVPPEASSIQILYRQWKWQVVDNWTLGQLVNSPVVGDAYTIGSLTSGVIYQFAARAWTLADANGSPSILGNDPRWRIPKGVQFEDTVDAIYDILTSDIAAAINAVDAKYDDGITLLDIKEIRKEDIDPDWALWQFPTICLVPASHTKETNTGTRNLFEHGIILRVYHQAEDSNHANHKKRLMRYREAIFDVLRDYSSLGGMAYRWNTENGDIEAAMDGNYMRGYSDLKINVETFE